MISLVIYGVIAIALASAAGYAFLTFTNVSRQTTQLQENQVRMETAASALRASFLALNSNGNLFVPAGVAGPSYTQLPSSLGVIASSPWGQPYLYCPLSLTGTSNPLAGTAATVTNPDASTYAITTYTSAITQQLPYVITSPTNVTSGGAPSVTGYIAFIVSTSGPGQQMPDCSAIVYTAPNPATNVYGGVTVPGGVVRGVTANFPFTQRVIASTDRMEIYVGQSSTGNGTGSDVNNQTTFDNAVVLWQALQPRLAEIYLTPGGAGYSSATTLDLEATRPYAQGENSSLVIGTTPGAAGQSALTLTSALKLSAATAFENVAVTSAAGATNMVYKPLIFRNASYTGASNNTINLYNTSLSINDSPMSYTKIAGSNSTVGFFSYLGSVAAPSAYTFAGVAIDGYALRVSFDALTASTFTINDNPPAASNIAAITLHGGSVNMGPTANISITTSGAPGIILSAATLNVSKSLTIAASDGTYDGFNFLTFQGGGIEDLDGSRVVIAASATTSISSNGVLDNAVFVRGSSLAVSGTLQALNVANGNVGSQAATLSGGTTGVLLQTDNTTPCLQFPDQFIQGTNPFSAPAYYPIFNAQSATAMWSYNPIFKHVQNGFPPMLSPPSISTSLNSTFDTTTANNLTYNSTPASPAAAGSDPYVTVSTAPTVFPSYFNVDKPSFENGIRTVLNNEFMLPISISYDGQCETLH